MSFEFILIKALVSELLGLGSFFGIPNIVALISGRGFDIFLLTGGRLSLFLISGIGLW